MSHPNRVTRRGVLGALAAVAASPMLVTRAFASRANWRRAATNGVADAGPGTGGPRYLHAAVSLPDGRVVVTGGYAASALTRGRTATAPTSSVQLYDPNSEEWYDLAPLNVPRARHAAVVLPDGRIAVLGGFLTFPLSSVEIYDPATNQWVEGEPLPVPMVDHAASVSGDRIVVTGGQDGVAARLIPVSTARGTIQP